MASEKLKILIAEFAADGIISTNEYALLKEKASDEAIPLDELDVLIANALANFTQPENAHLSGFYQIDEPEQEKVPANDKSGFYQYNEGDELANVSNSKNETQNNSSEQISDKSIFSENELFFSNEQLLSNQGNMSEIYVGIRHMRKVVIKRLKPADREKQTYIDLLFKEFHNSIALEHPNIARVFDSGEDKNGPFYYMEYVDGRPLTTLIGKFGIQSHKLVKKIALEILSALDYVHKKQVFHRDLKPENIMITFRGDNTKIIDFGLALADDFADNIYKVGTPKYASPEQKDRDLKVDGRSDLYSFGLILTEMISGDSKNIQKLATFSKKLEKIILRCTEPLPINRYLSAQEIIDDLEKISVERDKFSDKIERNEVPLKTENLISTQVPLQEKGAKENFSNKVQSNDNQNFKKNTTQQVIVKRKTNIGAWILFIVIILLGFYIASQMNKTKVEKKEQQEVEVVEPKIMYITAKKLRLRSSKSVEKKNVIGLYHKGTEVQILEIDENWARVIIQGNEGYMAFPLKYLSDEKPFEQIK